MEAGRVVIVNLQNPPEQFVGRLRAIEVYGITVMQVMEVLRYVDLAAFEDWISDLTRDRSAGLVPSTVFFPIHRIEKIMLDEDTGAVPSLAHTFMSRVGVPIDQFLE